MLYKLSILTLIVTFSFSPRVYAQRTRNEFATLPLTNGIITVTILPPGTANSYYKGLRFDHSGIVAQVESKNHTYFQNWQEYTGFDKPNGRHDAFQNNTATGTAEEFRDPLGYSDSAAKGKFIKIGVGILQKQKDTAYFFNGNYKSVEAGKWEVSAAKNVVNFYQKLSSDFGYGYEYSKRVIVKPNKAGLEIAHTLKNIGIKAIHTRIYCHNFFNIDDKPISPFYSVLFKNKISATTKIDGAEIKDRTLNLSAALKEKVVKGDVFGIKKNAFTVSDRSSNASISFKGNRRLTSFYIFCSNHAICPEPMIAVDVEPGESFSWSNNYLFH